MLTTILICAGLLLLFLVLNYFLISKKNKHLWIKYNTLLEELQQVKMNTQLEYKQLFKAWCIEHEKNIRKNSIERSRNIIRGQATEHLAPFIMEGFNPKDYRFLGNPIDYIIFNGASDVTDKISDQIDSVIFLDIKTGNSRLTKIQRRIKKCIEEGRVKFLTYNPDKSQD